MKIKNSKTKEILFGHILVMKNNQNLVTVNQHEVANMHGLNSGRVSVILREFIEKGFIKKVIQHTKGRPAVYEVCI